MVTEQAIDVARDDYVPIATHSTNLFFLIGEDHLFTVCENLIQVSQSYSHFLKKTVT